MAQKDWITSCDSFFIRSGMLLSSVLLKWTWSFCIWLIGPFCVQSPPGLKKNLLRTYESWSPEQISKGGNPARAQALFCLAWFHAVCQERRNYIPQVNTHRNTHTYLCVLFMDIMNNIFRMFKPRASEVKQTWPWVLSLGPGPPFFINRFGDKVSDTSKSQRSFNVWLPLTSFSLTPRTKNGQIIVFLLGICFILHRC